MTIKELSDGLKNDLFAKRNSMFEAYQYAISIAKSCSQNEIGVLTAIHVLLNTVSSEIKKCDDFKPE